MFENNDRNEDSRRSGPLGLAGLLLVALSSAVLLLTPGMLVVAAVNARLTRPLGPEVLWIGAVALSAAMFALVWGQTRAPQHRLQSPRLVSAWRTYLFLSVATVAVLAVMRYGFAMQFPETYLGYFTGADPIGQVSSLLAK